MRSQMPPQGKRAFRYAIKTAHGRVQYVTTDTLTHIK